MPDMNEMAALSGMKRSDLQKLAKKYGIKANMKTDDLIKALATVGDPPAEQENAPLSSNSKKGGSGQSASSASSTDDEITETSKPKSRRGRGKKRKAAEDDSPAKTSSPQKKETSVSVVENKSDAELTSSATEDEKHSPVTKKPRGKAAQGRGKGRGRRGKKVEVEAAAAGSPAPGGRRSRSTSRSGSRKATPVAAGPPAVLTPPNSGSSRQTKRAIRRTTHTPPARSPKSLASVAKTPTAPVQVPAAGKRPSRGASKTPPAGAPTPPASRTPEAGKGSSAAKRPASGSAGGRTKKVRRGTFDKSPSPGKRAKKEVVAEESSSTERIAALKDEIMAEIDRKVQLQVAGSKKGGIPTLAQPAKKTPGKKNWSKTHHGAFNKMESIDDYMERKRKRVEALSATKRPKIPVSVKSSAKPKGFDFSSPACSGGSTKTRDLPFASPKPSSKPTQAANPKSAKTVSFKVSKLKTPKKPALPRQLAGKGVAGGNVGKRQATPGVRRSASALTPAASSAARKAAPSAMTPVVKAARKSVSVVTPVARKSMGAATPGAQRKSLAGGDRKSLGASKTPSRKSIGGATATKNAFDLKASLAKPLGYKPHTGKLKPFGDSTQPNKVNPRPAPTNLAAAKSLVKKPRLKGREDRRAASTRHRAQKRDDSFMARRGVTAF